MAQKLATSSVCMGFYSNHGNVLDHLSVCAARPLTSDVGQVQASGMRQHGSFLQDDRPMGRRQLLPHTSSAEPPRSSA